jgi:hypothetical protein
VDLFAIPFWAVEQLGLAKLFCFRRGLLLYSSVRYGADHSCKPLPSHSLDSKLTQRRQCFHHLCHMARLIRASTPGVPTQMSNPFFLGLDREILPPAFRRHIIIVIDGVRTSLHVYLRLCLCMLRFEAARPVVGSGATRCASVAAGSGSERSKD